MRVHSIVEDWDDTAARATTRPMVTESRGAHEPPRSKFAQQELPAARPVLTPAFTGKVAIALAVVFLGVGGAVYRDVRDLTVVSKRYDDEPSCVSGFFPTEAEKKMQRSYAGVGTTCAVTLRADKAIKAPVYVYYELGNFFQNHRAYVRDMDYFQLKGEASQGLCTTHTTTASGADIVPCGVRAWSFFNDSFAIEVNGQSVTLDDTGIAWKNDLKYRLGSYAPENMNTDQTTRGGGRITGSTVDDDEHFATWMRTPALSTFRKLVGRLDTDIPKDTDITVTIDNRYNVYPFDGSKTVVIANSGRYGGYNMALPIMYLFCGAFCFVLSVVCLGMSYLTNKREDVRIE